MRISAAVLATYFALAITYAQQPSPPEPRVKKTAPGEKIAPAQPPSEETPQAPETRREETESAEMGHEGSRSGGDASRDQA